MHGRINSHAKQSKVDIIRPLTRYIVTAIAGNEVTGSDK